MTDAEELIRLYRQSPVVVTDEVQSQIDFIKVDPIDSEAWFDCNEAMRYEVSQMLRQGVTRADLSFVHALLQQETIYCVESWCSTDTLSLLAKIIFYLGDFSSLPFLWDSKNSSSDTWMTIGAREMFGAGVDATMTHLERANFPQKDDLIMYLRDELSAKPIRESVDALRKLVNQAFGNPNDPELRG